MEKPNEPQTYLELLLVLAKPARFLLFFRLRVGFFCRVRLVIQEAKMLELKIYPSECSPGRGIEGSVGPANVDDT